MFRQVESCRKKEEGGFHWVLLAFFSFAKQNFQCHTLNISTSKQAIVLKKLFHFSLFLKKFNTPFFLLL